MTARPMVLAVVPGDDRSMSHALYLVGRLSARRPFVVIACWLAVAVLVIAASGLVGRDLQDSYDVPGLDSQQAAALLTSAGSEQAGVTAQLAVTPSEDAADVEKRVAALPHVLSVAHAMSPDGRVALLRVHHPVLENLSRADLDALKSLVASARADTGARIEMGGDLFSRSRTPTRESVS